MRTISVGEGLGFLGWDFYGTAGFEDFFSFFLVIRAVHMSCHGGVNGAPFNNVCMYYGVFVGCRSLRARWCMYVAA